jgi:hypothetical protein
MPQKLVGQALDEAAQKWRRLAEKRCAHFLELYQSRRWKLYYIEERFMELAHEATQQNERWAKIAPQVRETPPPKRGSVFDARSVVRKKKSPGHG